MSPLLGFTNNQFNTPLDVTKAAFALLRPLESYKSSSNARIKIATATGAGFSETAAQLEGFARPLWVVADLLRLQTIDPHLADSVSYSTTVRLDTWIAGLKAGTDPKSPEYWGILSDCDQRMVEMESIAYALLLYPDAFSFADDPVTSANLITWLRQINEHEMPQNNWLWFRVLVNLALVRTLGVPLEGVKHHIDDSLRILDTFYVGEGWSSDGLWSDERKQADYYSGSFAIQFAQLLFVRFAADYDQERAKRYRKQAQEFGSQFWRYFSPDGAAIPFGRSLTYRFAMSAFFSAAAVAEVQLPAPLNHPGAVKGMLMRHLRWWAKQPSILNTDGTPSIGYCYPNMYLAEDYNSPQSVYWCLKSFLVLALRETHPFWESDELPHPLDLSQPAVLSLSKPNLEFERVKLLWPPRQILCNTLEHTFLLSSGQSTSKRFKGREAKYGKFAYSSAFGFSVPSNGPFLEQQAPDSTLAICFADEDDAWKVHWNPTEVRQETVMFEEEHVPTLVSYWRPWKRHALKVKTRLIPPVAKYPGWHLRVHHISYTPTFTSTRSTPLPSIRIIDSGFAASAQTSTNESIIETPISAEFRAQVDGTIKERWWNEGTGALVISESGASGVVNLTNRFMTSCQGLESLTKIIRADPNTNLIYPRTLIPSVEHVFTWQREGCWKGDEVKEEHVFSFVTGVFAVEKEAKNSLEDVWRVWCSRPSGRVAEDGSIFYEESCM